MHHNHMEAYSDGTLGAFMRQPGSYADGSLGLGLGVAHLMRQPGAVTDGSLGRLMRQPGSYADGSLGVLSKPTTVTSRMTGYPGAAAAAAAAAAAGRQSASDAARQAAAAAGAEAARRARMRFALRSRGGTHGLGFATSDIPTWGWILGGVALVAAVGYVATR